MTTHTNLNGRKVLVTGAAGFIGNEVCRQLLSAGASVTAIDNLVNGKRENLFDLKEIDFRVVDVRDHDRMRAALTGQSLVLHLACLGVRHSIHSPLENHEVNATATLHLVEIARTLNVGRFVYVSSSEVYGNAQSAPMTEQHPTWPMTVYGAAKLAGERYTDAFWRTYGYPTTIVRPFNTYGPRSHHEGDSGEVIPKFLLRALCGETLKIHGDGGQSRDFTYVTDTAAGIISCASNPRTIGETINLGSGNEITVNDLTKIVARVTSRKNINVDHCPARPGDVRRLVADITKARELFGFKCTVELDEGLRRIVEWYESRGIPLDELLKEETTVNWVSQLKTGA
jgi:UDP-glucose 4-epimerase